MTPKPAAIRWLEEATGQQVDYTPSAEVRDRHLSVRLTGQLGAELDALALQRGVGVSQLVRDVLEAEVARSRSLAALDERALVGLLEHDVAELRRRLVG
jgi:hypothetical protein